MRTLTLISALALAALSPAVTFHVSQTVGKGAFYLDFSLVDGAIANATNSTVTITNLAVRGGSVGASLTDLGDVTDLPNGFRLADGPAYTSVRTTAVSTTGVASSIAFDLSYESSADFLVEPDFFAYRLLDPNLDAAATSGFASEFVAVELGQDGNDAPLVYDNLDRRSQFLAVGTPSVQAVPEPVPLVLFGMGAWGMLRRKGRREAL